MMIHRHCNCKTMVLAASTVFIVLLLGACQDEPQRKLFNLFSGRDRRPPILLGTSAISEHTVKLMFDEPISCMRCAATNETFTESLVIEPKGESLLVTFPTPLPPGRQLWLSGAVQDALGNSTNFETCCWGLNARLPDMRINEFTTKGSGQNPDRIELVVLGDGNPAGAVLYDGTPESWDSCFIFPSIEVSAQDLLVVWFGIEPPRDQPTLLFHGGSKGLGSNNGVLMLCTTMEGSCLDAVIYSNRTSDSDVQYDGFGTEKVCQRVRYVEETGQWKAVGEGRINPESAIPSEASTATRSMCRIPGAEDTDSRLDWQIVPTGKSTFGFPNHDQAYVP